MIKKLFIISGFLFIFIIFPSYSFSQQNLDVEKIRNFDVNVIINKNGTVNIQENIKYDFGTNYRHGIIR